MKLNWLGLGQSSFGPIIDLRTSDVLAEYNGPQIVLATTGNIRYLGVAADEDDTAVRWVFAPVTPLELRALAAGVQSTRETFLKEGVLVVDYDHNDEIQNAWTIDGEYLEERALPKAHAVLPACSREMLDLLFPALKMREIALEQRNRTSPGIPFKAVSKAIDVFQRLWITLAAADDIAPRGRYSAELEDRATLAFLDACPGSLRIHVDPKDEFLFKEVSEAFSDLVTARKGSSAAYRNTAPRVLNRYKELLLTLQRHDLEIMTSGPPSSRPVFLGPDQAGRILSAFLEAEHIETSVLHAEGYFLTYSSVDAKFEFWEEEVERSFKGEVDADVLLSNRQITVGEEARYAVMIEVTKTLRHPNKPEESHRLRAAVELRSERVSLPSA